MSEICVDNIDKYVDGSPEIQFMWQINNYA